MRLHQHTKNKNTETGNVIFLILVAVVLLGLLTVVLSRSGSKVDQSGDVEQRNVRASEMLRYTKAVESAVQEMRLRGISENDFSFENTLTTNDYTNANCDDATDRSFPDCLLFNVDGAGLTYTPAPDRINDSSDWIFTAANDVLGVGTTAPDLIMILPNVGTMICTQINRLLNASYGGTENGVDFTAFTGAYTATETIDNAAGQESGCTDYNNGGTIEPFFYTVLIAR